MNTSTLFRRGSRPFWLAGCGIALSAALLPAIAAGKFDGKYTGPSNRLQGNDESCGPAMLTATADVSNDKFTIVWDRQRGISLTARIAPDGSISGQQSVGRNGVLEIKGKVKDASTLDYDFVSARCARHFVVKKG